MEQCGFRYYLANGETVTPCHKPKGHDGEHEGHCLGSRCVWTSDQPEDGDDPAYRRIDQMSTEIQGPAECPVACSACECDDGVNRHHWLPGGDDEGDHPAIVIHGLSAYFVCKHCEAWKANLTEEEWEDGI